MEILDGEEKFRYLLNSLINIVGKVKYPTQLLYEFSNWWGWFCFEQTNLSRISLWLAEVLVSLLLWKGSTTMTQFLTRIRRKAKEIVFVKRTYFVPLPKTFIQTLENLNGTKDPSDFFDVLTQVIAILSENKPIQPDPTHITPHFTYNPSTLDISCPSPFTRYSFPIHPPPPSIALH